MRKNKGIKIIFVWLFHSSAVLTHFHTHICQFLRFSRVYFSDYGRNYPSTGTPVNCATDLHETFRYSRTAHKPLTRNNTWTQVVSWKKKQENPTGTTNRQRTNKLTHTVDKDGSGRYEYLQSNYLFIIQ